MNKKLLVNFCTLTLVLISTKSYAWTLYCKTNDGKIGTANLSDVVDDSPEEREKICAADNAVPITEQEAQQLRQAQAQAESQNTSCDEKQARHYQANPNVSFYCNERTGVVTTGEAAIAAAGSQQDTVDEAQKADPNATASSKETANENSERAKKWDTCFTERRPKVLASCLYTAREDLKIPESSFNNRSLSYPQASGDAQECQAVFKKAKSRGDGHWKDIATDIYSNGYTEKVDYDQAVAHFYVAIAGEDQKEELDRGILSTAIRKVSACSQLAAVFGENIEEGRHEEDPYINPEKLTSLDGKIECHLMGLETLDYDECAGLVFAHNGSELGTAANNTYQQYEAQSLRSEQQQKLMNMDPNSNVTTAALKTQKDNIKTQQDMAEQRRALQAARLATIATMSAKIPTSTSYFETSELCERPVRRAIERIDSMIKTEAGNAFNEYQALCKDNVTQSSFAFFRNANAKRIGNSIAAQAGVEVAAETMAVSQLGKQKRMIDGAIGKIEGMNTLELPEDFYQNEDVYMQFCTANPTHPDCQTGFGATVNVPSFGDYNVGGFGTNQAYQPTDTTESTGAAGSTTSDPTSANVDTSTAVTKSSPSGGLKGRFGSGATVTEGGGLAQGAGGGGSNPGGGGGGGGSSAGGGGDPQAGATAASGGTKGLSYIGGRGPSFVGGRGIASRRKNTKNDANPFKNMFDKNKNRNLSSLNFKGKAAIGSKSGNLFQRISSAYDKANNKGNLLKYETKSIE